MSAIPKPIGGQLPPNTPHQAVVIPEGADAPEVYERADAPEVYQRADAPEVYQQADIPKANEPATTKSPGYSDLEAVPRPHPATPPAQRPPIWKRRWIWFLLAGVIILAVVGIAVGLTVSRGSSSSRSTENTSSGNSSSSKSACHGIVCPQILAAAVQNSLVHVFARGSDDDIWYRTGDGVSWTEPWISLEGGPFASQPTAMSWWPGRLNVFAIAAGKFNVLSNGYSNGSFSYWENLGESSLSPVGLCVLNSAESEMDDRIDPWIVSNSTHAVVHNFYMPKIDDFWSPAEGPAWENSMSNLESASTPALACRGTNPYHNLVLYSMDGGSLRHRTWLDTTGWQTWNDWGESFVSDPVVVPIGTDRFDFFGIGADNAMHHLTWTNSSGATPLESLNGTFESIPSIAVTGYDPIRLDIVALGADDMIKHRALIGSSWTDDWEDMGVFGNSAPLVFQIDTNGSQNRTGLWVIGENNELYYNSWETSSAQTWKGLGSWQSMGGDWTTDFLSVL